VKKLFPVVAILAVAAAAWVGWHFAAAIPDAPPVKAHWLTDFAAASAQAKAENKPLLINFTGSDWCASCLLIDRYILNTQAFKDYADQHLVLVVADFPVKNFLPAALADQNQARTEKFQILHLPAMTLLNSQGQKLFQSYGYVRGTTAETLIDRIKFVTGQDGA